MVSTKTLVRAYSGKFVRRRENLSCFPLLLPAKTTAFQEAVLALMRVAEVCVSSPWFPAYHATPCGNLFLLPPVLSTQPAGFDCLGHIPFLAVSLILSLESSQLILTSAQEPGSSKFMRRRRDWKREGEAEHICCGLNYRQCVQEPLACNVSWLLSFQQIRDEREWAEKEEDYYPHE